MSIDDFEYVPVRIAKTTQQILREVYKDIDINESRLSLIERSLLGLPPENHKDILDQIFEEYNNATTSSN